MNIIKVIKRIFFAAILISIINYNVICEEYKWNKPSRKKDPIASTDAVKGGSINIYSGQSPKSLNYYLDNNTFSLNIFTSLFDTLLNMDPLTSEYSPSIAEKWAITEDGLSYIFQIDKKARWSDGKAVTSADIKFTYDAIMDPKNLTGVHKVGLEIFQTPQIIDTYTIKFTAREKHWKNMLELSGLIILPEHNFKNKDFNKINFEFPVVSGPYKLKKIIEGRVITLERRKDWWQRNYPDMKNTYNFDIINHKIFSNTTDAFDIFKKGEIDIYPVYISKIWVNETNGEKFDKNWIIKQNVHNYNPIGFQGFAMNSRKEIFSDKRVRKAIAHLINRKMMNEKLMYNQYFMHKSYFEDLYDKTNICMNQLIEFNKNEARKLFKEAGWTVNSKGNLEKNGKEFIVEILERDKSTEKFVNIMSEDFKDVGIQVKVSLVDFAEWAKRMDEFSFDMTWASWSSGIFKDAEGMWHSKEADRLQGNNITGFKNAEVDMLIDSTKTIFELQKRNDIIRKIDRLIFNEHPYALLWNINSTRLLYWNKFGKPKTVLSKYGDERSAYMYWWHDKEKSVELSDAINEKESLTPEKSEIYFDDEFEKSFKKRK